MTIDDANFSKFIQGPKESSKNFLQRINRDSKICDKKFDDALSICILKKHYELSPESIRVIYSDDDIPFFVGGLSMISLDDKGVYKAHVQMRKKFLHNNKIFFIYDKEEILAHEYFHCIRCAFDDSEYEEILAYRMSSSSLRKFFGPLFSSTIFCTTNAITMMAIIAFSILGALFENEIFITLELISYLSMMTISSYYIAQQLFLQWQLRKCCKNLKSCFSNNLWSIICRLSDEEISSVAKLSNGNNVKETLKSLMCDLRWKGIESLCYM